jgi:hypothetical protein
MSGVNFLSPMPKEGKAMDEWYYRGPDGNQVGPISAYELSKLAGIGTLAPETLVRKGNETEWAPAERVKGLFVEPHIVGKPTGDSHPPLPGRLYRMLVPTLLSVLIVVASVSVVLQARILKAVSANRLVGIPVTITNTELDVNVQNRELDVNVQNTELDVKLENHNMTGGDAIPVTIVK